MEVGAADVRAVLSWLKEKGTAHDRANLVRFGITAKKAFGVSVANIRVLAKEIGRSHDLAAALWETGWYEARMLTSFVDEPARVTSAQMDRWCRDFDNWAICDTLCFHLFDRTPHSWTKVAKWATSREEFVKRASFALLASIALHDKCAPDEPFRESLPRIEQAAADDRDLVRKGVSWALRSLGRRNRRLHADAVSLARRMAESKDARERWVGKDAIRDLTKLAVLQRLKKGSQASPIGP